MRGLAVVAVVGASLMWTAPAQADANELCRFDSERLSEISGLASSALHEGIVWAHNDSGGGPFLYALDIETCEIRATLKVRGVDAVDPEAIAIGTGAGGAPAIWWGDIGDNTGERRYVEIHEITEPGELLDGAVTPTTYRVRLDRAEDAEALVADGDQLWLIGKGLTGGTIWRLPSPLPQGDTSRAKAVGTEDALVTDAAMRPGGGYAVRDYSEVRIYSGQPPGTLIERMPLPEQIQGEAMTWTADGTGLIVASEGDDRLLLVPVTSPVENSASQPTDTETTAPSSAPSSPAAEPLPDDSEAPSIAPSPVADALEPVDRVGSLAVIALAIGAAVFIVSAAAVPVIARVRSRR
ncbi:MAG: hypothetical protein RL347_1198 [Actinomycetota bacterium]